jgi:glutaredoxin
LKLAQQQQRAAEARNLKIVPDIQIKYVGAPCYRTVYCICCRGFIGSGSPLYQPVGDNPPPKPQPKYKLSFGPTSCECLLPLLDADYVDELQLDVAHPWSPDVIVTHTFGKQEFPPVDLENHHTLPVLDYHFTTEQTEMLMKALSTNKRAMHVTVKAYAAEVDYKGEVTTRTLLGTGTVDLGVFLLNKASQSEAPLGKGDDSSSKESGVQYQMTVLVESNTASRDPMARVTLDFRGDARAWNVAYAWRLRRIYHPESEEVNICRDCFRMAETFNKQQKEITARWVKKHKELKERADETQRNKGALGVGLDYVIFTACPSNGRHSAARSLAEADRLSDNFLSHVKDESLAVPAEFYSPEQLGGSKLWGPKLHAT